MLATTIAMEVTTAVTMALDKLNKRVGGLATSVGHYRTGHKTLSQQLLDLQQGYDARLSKLATTINLVDKSHSTTNATGNTSGRPTAPPHATHVAPPSTPPATAVSGVLPGVTETSLDGPGVIPPGNLTTAGAALHWSREHRPPPSPVNTNLPPCNGSVSSPEVFQIPNSHLTNIVDYTNPGVLGNTSTAWHNAHETAHQYLPEHTAQDEPRGIHAASVTPLKGGLIYHPITWIENVMPVR